MRNLELIEELLFGRKLIKANSGFLNLFFAKRLYLLRENVWKFCQL